MNTLITHNNPYQACVLCSETNVAPAHFWQEHHLKESEYCLTYLPRYSKLTGELIQFKNRNFYFSSDFNDKNELKRWIKQNPVEALEYSTELLKRRKDQGKIKYAPSQVELRSLCSPNVLWYNKNFDYNELCKQLGLINRFKYKIKLKRKEKIFSILIDTREQRPLNFEGVGLYSQIRTLPYGDYTAEGVKTNLFIERKGLSDFVSTLSSGFDRFCREIERSKKDKKYLIVLVEASIGDAMAFNMLPYVSKKIKASPEFIWHKVRALMQTYDNLQFAFVDGRVKAAEFIKTIYTLQNDVSKLDLQYLIDSKFI